MSDSDTVAIDSEKTVIADMPDTVAAPADASSPETESDIQAQIEDAVAEAPAQVSPPPTTMAELEPESLPESAPKKEKSQSLSQRMESALESLNVERERLQGLTDRHISRERLIYLRDIGVMDQLKDSQVLALAPSADPSTPEGRASLDDFRAHNSGLFKQRANAERIDPKQFAADVPKSKHGTFGMETALKILRGDKSDVG